MPSANSSTNASLVTQREQCVLCGATVPRVVELPALPFTDSYTTAPGSSGPNGIDQALLHCPHCNHGQLQALVAPSLLYGHGYSFRTGASASAQSGTDFFLSFLGSVAPERRFRCALDIGCNDLHLLKQLHRMVDYRVGVDPIWAGREYLHNEASIAVYGCTFDELDLASCPAPPDLVVCRHTLEHVIEPRQLVASLLAAVDDNALCLFEVPCFDGLLQRLRFDQVFHQHAQYFTLSSLLHLIESNGGQYLAHRFSYHNWGALAIAFTKSKAHGGRDAPTTRAWSCCDITTRYKVFRRQMEAVTDALGCVPDGPLYGYGAAQMLPVLAYHMGIDFSGFVAILDDDPAKDGIGYWNLPVGVIAAERVRDLSDATVLVTAVDNVAPIMTRLLARRPRHLIYPLGVI